MNREHCIRGAISSIATTAIITVALAAALFIWGGRLSVRADKFDREMLRLLFFIAPDVNLAP